MPLSQLFEPKLRKASIANIEYHGKVKPCIVAELSYF